MTRSIDFRQLLKPDGEIPGGQGSDAPAPGGNPQESVLNTASNSGHGPDASPVSLATYEPIPTVTQVFKTQALDKSSPWSAPVHPSEIAAILRYFYLREEAPEEPGPIGELTEYQNWIEEVRRVLGDNFSSFLPDPALYHHTEAAPRNTLLAWTCAMQQAEDYCARHPEDPLVCELQAITSPSGGPPLLASSAEREQYVHSVVAATRFYKDNLKAVEDFNYIPPLSLNAITQHLGANLNNAESLGAITAAYSFAAYADRGPTSHGISDFASVTRSAALLAQEGAPLETILTALLSQGDLQGVKGLREHAVLGKYVDEISRQMRVLKKLKSEAYFPALPRDLTVKSYGWRWSLSRLMQRSRTIAEQSKSQILTPRLVFLLMAVSRLEEFAVRTRESTATTEDEKQKIRNYLYSEVLTLLAPAAERTGRQALNNRMLDKAFRMLYPQDSAVVECGICESFQMSKAQMKRSARELRDRIHQICVGESLDPENFRIDYRIKNLQSTVEKGRHLLDYLAFRVCVDSNEGYRILKEKLPDLLGPSVEGRFSKRNVTVNGVTFPVEIKMQEGLEFHPSHRLKEAPHDVLKGPRRINWFLRTFLPHLASDEFPGVDFDQIDPPMTGDAELDYNNILKTNDPYCFVSTVKLDDLKNEPFPCSLNDKLPIGAIAVDLLATLHGSSYASYTLIRRESPQDDGVCLGPLDKLIPGETLYIRKATQREKRAYRQFQREIAAKVLSVPGVFYTQGNAISGSIRQERRKLGEDRIESIFGAPDAWLTKEVLRPFCHWKRLLNVEQLMEALGTTNNVGGQLLPVSELSDWFFSRYVKFDAEPLGDGMIRIDADENQRLIFKRITSIAKEMGLLISEMGSQKPSIDSGATVLLQLDSTQFAGDTGKFEAAIRDFCLRVSQIRSRRGQYPPEQDGMRYTISLNLAPGPEAPDLLADVLMGKSGQEPNIDQLSSSRPQTDPLTLETTVPMTIQICSHQSELNEGAAQLRARYVKDLLKALQEATFPGTQGAKLCSNVTIKVIRNAPK